MDDQILIAMILDQGKIERGYALLLQQYQKPIYWHVRRIVYRHEDADDIVQNTFIKVFRHLSNFRRESKLSTWIFRIATNEALSHLSLEAKRRQLSLDELSIERAQDLSSDQLFEQDEAVLILQQCVAKLPQQQRLVFQMRYFDEMKYSDIADILDTSVGALKANYHHAVAKIKTTIVHYQSVTLLFN